MADKVCYIDVCGQINPYEEVCGEIDPFIRFCATFCDPGADDDLTVCDISFIDYQTSAECVLSIDSVDVDGATATVNASGGIGPVLYRFVKSDGTVARDWGVSNTEGSLDPGNYFAQTIDSFNCTDFEGFEVV